MTLMQFIQKEKVKREEKSHKYNNKASYTSDVSEPTTFWLQKGQRTSSISSKIRCGRKKEFLFLVGYKATTPYIIPRRYTEKKFLSPSVLFFDDKQLGTQC